MNLWPAFEQVWAPEEVYFPTALALCGHMDEVLSEDDNDNDHSSSSKNKNKNHHNHHAVIRRALTHSQWDERAANHKDRAHPLSYDGCFDHELVRRVRQNGCLFLRKMAHPLDVNLWEQIVVHRQKGDSSRGGIVVAGKGDVERGGRRDWESERGRGRGVERDRQRGHDRGSSHGARRDYDDRREYDSRRGHHDDGQHWRRKRDRDYSSSYDGSSRGKRRHWR